MSPRPTRACSSLRQLDAGQQSTSAAPQHPSKVSEAAAEELPVKLDGGEPVKRPARGKRKANQAVDLKEQSPKPKRRSGFNSVSTSDGAMHQFTLLSVAAMHACQGYCLHMLLVINAAIHQKEICIAYQVQGINLIVTFILEMPNVASLYSKV